MALTVEDAITAIVTQADTLAGTSTAEDLVYLAKSLEAVSDTRQASDAAVQAVVDRANGLSAGAASEDLIYLAKAVEALSTASVTADVTAKGNTQVGRILEEGDTQVQRVINSSANPIGAPDWPVTLTYNDLDSPVEALYAKGEFRYRETLSYNGAGQLATVLIEDSVDAGLTWSELGIQSLYYNTAGNLTHTEWIGDV